MEWADGLTAEASGLTQLRPWDFFARLLHPERGLQHLDGGFSHQDFEVAGRDGALHLQVVGGEFVGRQVECHGAGLAGIEGDAGEVLQLLHGANRQADDVVDIELDDLIGFDRSGVGDIY